MIRSSMAFRWPRLIDQPRAGNGANGSSPHPSIGAKAMMGDALGQDDLGPSLACGLNMETETGLKTCRVVDAYRLPHSEGLDSKCLVCIVYRLSASLSNRFLGCLCEARLAGGASCHRLSTWFH